jgi:phosphoribosylformylglycinamidine synthase
MTTVRVLIQSKPGVLDPEGEAVKGGIERLGHEGVERVGVGKVVDIDFVTDDTDEIESRVEQICDEFLVNPIIERYSYEILDNE